ncbi:hypothetical protein GE09DRAFT_1217814 [Coniochaeta sp. 2T2.1]|nr:hypothetical protein GE09DRAFT_1217814 [Coniochaeta sp. 2T2.1]
MSPSTSTPSNSQPSSALVEPNMADEATGAAAQNASPAKAGRGGRSKGRGGRPPAKSRVKAPKVAKAAANAKQGAGRGRRQKVYDFVKAQAAYERESELKSNYNQLARAMKLGLNELVDRAIARLTNDPHAHLMVPEAGNVNEFLDRRFEDTIKTADIELEMQLSNATKLRDANIELARKECTDKILEAQCDMYDSLLAQAERLEFLHDNNLPINLPDTSYQYMQITQQQVEQQGPYVHHDERGVPVPCSERVTTISSLMNEDYLFMEEHRPKRKADEEPEGQPGAKRLGLLGLEDDVPRRTSALMSAHDDVGERSATPAEEQPEAARKPTKAARGKASAKQTWTTTNGTVVDEKDEELLDVEEVNGLPLPKGASLPDEYGVRIITKSRKAEYANNRIMAPVASLFEDWQIGYRDSSNSSLKGANKARRRTYLGGPNSNAAFYDRRVANYNSVLQKEDDYDQELVKKHNLHPTLGLFLPNSVNEGEHPVQKELQQYNPVVQVGPQGQIFHASRSVHAMRLDQEAKKRELKDKLSKFMTKEEIAEDEVAPPKELQEQHREAMLRSMAIDPATLPVPRELSPSPPPGPSPSPSLAGADDEAALAEQAHSSIEALLHAADQVASEEHATKVASSTPTHKSSRPYDAIRDVFTENAPAVPPVSEPTATHLSEGSEQDSYMLSALADVATNYDAAKRHQQREAEKEEAMRRAAELQAAERVELERQEHLRRESERMEAQRAEQSVPPMRGPAPVEVSVMDPRLFPHEGQQGNVQLAGPEAPQSQYPDPPQLNSYHSYEPAPQWQREEPPVQFAEPPRGHDFLRTALNPQTPPPLQPNFPPYPAPNYQGQTVSQGSPTQAPQPQGSVFINAGPERGSLPALRPVRTSFDAGVAGPEYQGSPTQSHRSSLVASNSGSFYPPPPPRAYHNGYLAEEPQNMHPQQPPLGPPPPHYQQAYPPPHLAGYSPHPYPPPPENGYYNYPPIAPVPGGAAYQTAGPYNPMAQHPMAPMPRGQPGNNNRSYRKLEPAPPQQPKPTGARAQRPELRTVPFDYGSIKDYVPVEAPPSHGPPSVRGWSHQNLKHRRPSRDVPAPTNEPS